MKMSKNLNKCYDTLKTISQISDPVLLKKNLLYFMKKKKNYCLYSAIHEICANTVNKNIKLNNKQKKLLLPYQTKINNLATFTKNKSKRKKLILQSGGFLPILIPALASVLTTLASNLIK